MIVVRICCLCRGQFSGEIHADPVCDQCVADARLGRMVRAMPEGSELIHAKRGQIFDPGMRAWGFEFFNDSEDDEDDRSGSGDAPEEALARAGVKG